MIKKTIIVAIALLMTYAVFVVYFAPSWWSASQHQWQDNVIKAQKFVYNKDSFDNVIIGTSLSCRLVMDSLPHTYNLSFQGQSIYEGLEILKHKAILPKNVFIEMNVVLKEENINFTSDLYSPILYYSKKMFPALREDKQPIAIIGAKINDKLTRRFIDRMKIFFHLKDENFESKTDKILLSKLLALQIQGNSKVPERQLLDRCFKKIKKYVSILEKRGVNINFFEIPVNNALNQLPRPTLVRSTFYENFSPLNYKYIPIPDSLKFETTDGIHLNKEEALIYTIYLKSKMKDYL